MNNEVVKYISDAINVNLGELEIKRNLLEAGWDPNIVEDSFAHFRASQHKPTLNKDEDVQIKQKTTPTETSVSIVSKTNVPTTALKELNTATGIPWYKKIILLPIILLILAGGFFAFYTFIYASPNKVWQKFTNQVIPKTLTSKIQFSYTDNKTPVGETETNIPVKNLVFGIEGNLYANTENSQAPQSSSDIKYTFTSGNTNFTTSLSYKLINKKFYLNVGENPYLDAILSEISKDKKIDWLMLDLAQLEQMSGEESSFAAFKLENIFTSDFNTELKNIWTNSKLVKMDKYLGKEKINGITTLHFNNTIDKTALQNALTTLADKFMEGVRKAGGKAQDEDVKLFKIGVEEIINKIEVKEFQTWVGIKDFRLYKIRLKISAPSLVSAVDVAMEDSRNSSRDAKRLADIRQMASALELYFNDKGKYPESKEGSPVNLAPTYIGLVPTAPIPADGNCTDYFNTYWYEQKNKGQSYEYSFCLGKNVGGYQAGIQKLTPSGITEVKECPTTPDKCYKTANKIEESESQKIAKQNKETQIKDAIAKINFNADLDFSAEYSDYGVIKPITAPEDAFDLMEFIKTQRDQMMK
jgi:hypothetical protein